jgi:hypothetical protein
LSKENKTTESYKTFPKAFREMVEAIWLRDWQPLPEDAIPAWVLQADREDDHALAAEEKTLTESKEPKSKSFSPMDRLHMKFTAERPGLDEVKVTKRMLRKKRLSSVSPPKHPTLEEEILAAQNALGQSGSSPEWQSTFFLVNEALRDVEEFRSVTPTTHQEKILHAAALMLETNLTEKQICDAFQIAEKTLREWYRLLKTYSHLKARILEADERRREFSIKARVSYNPPDYGV